MSRSAAAALSALLGALLGIGLLVVLEQPRNGTEAIAPLAAAATDAPPSTAPAPGDRPTVAPVAPPVRVVIPSIDVDADLVAVGLNTDLSMEVPEFGEAGWYELGPRPGEPGPAVITAHVDSVDGPDVFHRLTDLAAGDEITVERADGTSSVFVMRRAEQQLKDELPVERIWAETDEPVLRLITCGGEFDETRRSYRSNVIVYARGVDV
jgi:sortase (surface protein transpeptidase)